MGLAFAPTAIAVIQLNDRKDLLIHSDSVSALGAEPSIAVHPGDWKTLLMSLAASGGVTAGCAGWISTDGGLHWTGNNEPAHSPGRGDPFVAIRRGSPTRYFILSIGDTLSASAPFYSGGQRIVWTDSATSTSWSGQGLAARGVPEHPQKTDKGCVHVDNDSTSSFAGRAYAAWFDVEGGARLSYSTNGGADWLHPPVELRATGETWGVAIATAINGSGNVYTAWPQGTGGAPGSILFRMSDDGGASFADPVTAANLGGSGIRFGSSLGNHSQAKANSAPSMATDEQGNIYMAWCQGAGSVYLAKSDEEGENWSTLGTISSNTAARHWHPWIAWDAEAKALVAVYHDDRADDDSTQVYMAVSYDRGSTFQELKISDWQGSGDVFVGDYLSVACGGGVAYPVWCDDRDGQAKAYTSPVLVGGIDSATITSVVGQSCAGTGNPRVRFEVDWSTLVAMDGTDKLTVTPPGGSPQVASAVSTGTSHTLVVYDLPCVNGTWKYVIESNKGTAASSKSDSVTSVTCISCPPPCNPPCELD